MLNPPWTPVPLTGTTSGDPDALLVMLTDPLIAAEAVGANTTLKLVDADAAKVIGNAMPLTETPAPLKAIVEICTEVVPVLVSVTFCVALLPTATLPKLTVVGFACNCPGAVEDPVPSRLMMVVGFTGSLLVIVTFPVVSPEAVG